MAFDPYHKWLGIPPDQQPASHYRLLAIEEFESDADVIETAAERQTGFLRTFQTGPDAELAERLLNEVAAARVCLLRPASKAEYDDSLRNAVAEAEPPPATAEVPAPPAVFRAEYELPKTSVTPERHYRKNTRPNSLLVPLVVGGVLLIPLVVVMWWFIGRGGSDEIAKSKTLPTQQTPDATAAESVDSATKDLPPKEPVAQPGAFPPIAVKAKSVDLLPRMRSQPDLLGPGWSWASSFFLVSPRANRRTVTVPVPELAEVSEYTLVFDFENVGRRTGVPTFLLDFPVYGGGHLRAHYYYGASYSLSFRTTDELQTPATAPQVNTRDHLGRRELEVHVGKQRIRVELNGQVIGEFDTPKSKPNSATTPPTVRMTSHSGSWMHYRVHQLQVILDPAAKSALR